MVRSNCFQWNCVDHYNYSQCCSTNKTLSCFFFLVALKPGHTSGKNSVAINRKLALFGRLNSPIGAVPVKHCDPAKRPDLFSSS